MKQHRPGKTQSAHSHRPPRRRSAGLSRPLLYVATFLVAVTAMVAFYKYVIFAAGHEDGIPTTHPAVLARLVVEAGDELPPASRFTSDQTLELAYADEKPSADLAVPGDYPIRIQTGDQIVTAILAVVDTKPPRAMAVDQEIWLGEADSFAPDDFVTQIRDVTPVSLAFRQPPDLQKAGDQAVIVLLKDSSGNQAEVTARLTVLQDIDKPVIAGATDQTVFIGDTISYRENVTVSDNRDPQPVLEIDNSQVNLSAAGTYPVRYKATDKAGNTAEVTITVTVQQRPEGYVSEDELYALVDQVLAEITTDDMSDLEVLSEIFYWIADHIDYTGTSDKSDWVKGAFLGMTRGTGDCFNYFSTAKAFLTRAGYETIPIERVQDAKTRHYWNLVQYNGAWYHFDPMPNLAKYHYVCLLRTDAEVADYSRQNPRFYEYDPTGIPATPTEPLDIERKVING